MSWARASYLSLISVKFLKASYAKSVKDYSDSNRTWSVLDARVCLPAVLNDPRNPIRNSEPLPTPPPTFLPKVSRKNFDTYLAKLQKRVSPEELQAPYKNCQFFNIFIPKESIFFAFQSKFFNAVFSLSLQPSTNHYSSILSLTESLTGSTTKTLI